MSYFTINNVDFLLSNKCEQWFALPEKDVYSFIDTMETDDIFFDIGGCEGRFAVYSGKKNIKTFVFEPDKYNFLVLNENITINNLYNIVKTYKIAVSNVNKKLNLFKNQPWFGGHLKILENGERLNNIENYAEIEVIDAFRLDDFIIQNNIPFPTHIKVDIDGSEKNFIEGSNLILQKIKKIHIELTDDNKDYIINEFKNLGLNIEIIYNVYDVFGKKYEGLYNYIFSK